MQLNEAYKKVREDVLKHSSIKKDVHSAVLSLHESATKVWQAVENKQADKMRHRAASTLISAFYVMQELGIDDPEECLMRKLDELKKEV